MRRIALLLMVVIPLLLAGNAYAQAPGES